MLLGCLYCFPREGSVCGGKLAELASLPVCLRAKEAIEGEIERRHWIYKPLGLWLSFPSSRLCRVYIGRPTGDFSL